VKPFYMSLLGMSCFVRVWRADIRYSICSRRSCTIFELSYDQVLTECVEAVEPRKMVMSFLIWPWTSKGRVFRKEMESDGKTEGKIAQIRLHWGKVCQHNEIGKSGIVREAGNPSGNRVVSDF
jgi:hypothetical protein